MVNDQIINEILENINKQQLIKITFSNFRTKELELEKVLAKLILIKKEINIQFEYRYKRIIKHENIQISDNTELKTKIEKLFLDAKDINIQTTTETVNVKISKKYKYSINKKESAKKQLTIKTQNNKKNYILDEDKKYTFLVELGIQNNEGKIKKERRDKFKQINKYLEFIRDAVNQLQNNKTIKILDFGSGKSYLTFAAYYYLTNELNVDCQIIGIDLKKEVIDNCNKIATKLNFKKLKFVYGDVADYTTDDDIDIVISLHACDIATDIALIKSINWQAKIILAVPCCQKEINSQLPNTLLPFMLKHGIIREKFATLFTDSIRSELLNTFGYKADVIEFISEENTPKNQLIRAYKSTNKINIDEFKKIQKYLNSMSINMYLINEADKIIENISDSIQKK